MEQMSASVECKVAVGGDFKLPKRPARPSEVRSGVGTEQIQESWPCDRGARILSPLHQVTDRTCVLLLQRHRRSCCATAGALHWDFETLPIYKLNS